MSAKMEFTHCSSGTCVAASNNGEKKTAGTSACMHMSEQKSTPISPAQAAVSDIDRAFATPTDEPTDKYHFVKAAFVVQGVGYLLPWNACLTITSYWNYKLQGSQFLANYMNYFTFVNCGILFFTSGAFSRLQHKTTLYSRVSVPLISQTLVMVGNLILVFIDGISGDAFFLITIALIVIASLAVGIQQPGVYSVAAYLPEKYIGYAIQGEAWGGVFVSLLAIFVLLGVSDVLVAASIFFSISVAILIMCYVSYLYILRSEIFRFWYAYRMPIQTTTSGDKEKAADSSSERTVEENDDSVSWAHYFFVFRRSCDLAFSAWFNYTVTLMIYPVLPLSIVPLTQSSSRFFGDMWVPVVVFLFFSIFDAVGRFSAPYILVPRKFVALLSLARVVLIPMFLMCNGKCVDVATGNLNDSLPPNVFMHDAFPIIFNILLAFTGGYTTYASMHYTPTTVEGKDRSLASTIVTTFLMFGLLSGTLMSFAAKAINCGGNPFSA